jgi:hypothetical protein
MGSAAPPPPKKIRVVNKEKERLKISKAKAAEDGRANARKKRSDAEKTALLLQSQKFDLERTPQEKRTEEVNEELIGIQKAEAEAARQIAEALMEESAFEKESKDIEMLDVMDFVDGSDIPLPSVENPPPIVDENLAALLEGTYLNENKEYLSLDEGSGLRETQKVVGYKGGLQTTAFVYDSEISSWPIFRLRKDLVIDEKEVPNIMDWRRAGTKKKGSKERWGINDVKAVKGIAIAVPPGYTENPENLVVRIPRMSQRKKDKLKKEGKRVPRQPDVQLLIEWKTPKGVIPLGGTDEEDVYLSWESRGGCARIWKKKVDEVLVKYAQFHEVKYRLGGGKHSSEEPELSPFNVPSPGSSEEPPSSSESGDDTETEKEKKARRKKEKEKRAKRKRDKKKWGDSEGSEEESGSGDDTETEKKKPKKKKPEKEKPEEEKPEEEKPEENNPGEMDIAMTSFDKIFRARRRIPADAELTSGQEGAFADGFEEYWKIKEGKNGKV